MEVCREKKSHQTEETAYKMGEKGMDRWEMPGRHLMGLITKIYRELKTINSQRTNNLINKWENELNRQFSKE
jgi:hypothetical protein